MPTCFVAKIRTTLTSLFQNTLLCLFSTNDFCLPLTSSSLSHTSLSYTTLYLLKHILKLCGGEMMNLVCFCYSDRGKKPNSSVLIYSVVFKLIIEDPKNDVSSKVFFSSMRVHFVKCLLTTQQNNGITSSVHEFVCDFSPLAKHEVFFSD